MLIEFSVANYLSFKDKVTLSMEAGNIKEYEEDNTFEAGKYHLLKSAAIYGANASGKSNLIKAMDFMKDFIQNSSKDSQSGEEINIIPFKLNIITENQPSFFEIILFIEGITYRYGFEVTQDEVISEWLFETNKKPKVLFLREEGNIDVKSSFKEGKNLEDKTRTNALFLSVVAQFNGKIANKILDNLTATVIFIGVINKNFWTSFTIMHLNDSEEKSMILPFLSKADLGIVAIEVDKNINFDNFFEQDEQGQKKLADSTFGEIYMKYDKYDGIGNIIGHELLNLETSGSEGTKKYFNLFGLITSTLKLAGTLFIDEIDAKLHPILTKQIIKLFNSKETNPKNAQLIFATHDTNLLSAGILRRDQIWFTEKNRQGATDLYSLLEFKLDDDSKVRNDASFEKDYLKGRYGAIPYLGDFSKIFKPEN